MHRTWLLQTHYLDEAAQGWVTSQTNTGVVQHDKERLQAYRPSVGLVPSPDQPVLLSIGPERAGHTPVDYLASMVAAHQAQTGQPLPLFSLLPHAHLAAFTGARFEARFNLGGRSGNGVLELEHVQGRWLSCRWREDATPTASVQPTDQAPPQLVLFPDPPMLVLHDAPTGGVRTDRLLGIQGSSALVVPPQRADWPDDHYYLPLRQRVRRVLGRGIGDVFSGAEWPIALDALRLVDSPALRPFWTAGGLLELQGGDRIGTLFVDGRETEPTRLVARRPSASDTLGAWVVAALDLAEAAPPGRANDLEGALAQAVVSDFEAALSQQDCLLVGGTSAPPPSLRVLSRRGREWHEPEEWARIDQLRQRLDDEPADLVQSRVLDPATNRHHGGLPYDNACAWELFVSNFGRAMTQPDDGWPRALYRLLRFWLEDEGHDTDSVVATYRGPRTFPVLRRDPDRPLTLLYDRRGTTLLRETWRWLLPRGSLIRRGVNRLDDDLAPLDGGLYLE